MTDRRFLVLHGWENHRPVEHWEWWLTDQLRGLGEHVLYPQLPSPDEPQPEDWLAAFEAEWLQMGAGERVVVAHSLSSLLVLHAAGRGLVDPAADRILLVAPPSPEATLSYPQIAAFVLTADTADPAAVWAASRTTVRLVCSDSDPYSPEGTAATIYAEPLGMDAEVVPGIGHVTIDDGFGPWPLALAWCLDPVTRFTGM